MIGGQSCRLRQADRKQDIMSQSGSGTPHRIHAGKGNRVARATNCTLRLENAARPHGVGECDPPCEEILQVILCLSLEQIIFPREVNDDASAWGFL